MRNQKKIGIILSYLAMALNMLVQLMYTPIMIRTLGQSEYGVYTYVGSIVGYLNLFSLGFTGAYLRFYSRYEVKNEEKYIERLNGLFLMVFMIMSSLAIIVGMGICEFCPQIFGGKLTEEELGKAMILMKILVVNIALSFPASLFDSMISAHEKFLFQKIITLLAIILNPLLCIPLLFKGYGSVMVVGVITFLTITRLILNILYCRVKLHVRFRFRNMDKYLLYEIATFSFFIFINMIIDQINWSVDKFILGRVSGTVAVAVYGVGANINALYTNFSTAISSVFAPQINRIAAESKENMEDAFSKIFIMVGRIQFIVLSLVLLGFITFGTYFITEIYATREYQDAYIVTLLLIVPATIPLIQNIGLEIQRAVNKHQFRSIIYLLMAVFNIFISIPMARKFGPIGSAFGTALSLLLANGLVMNVFYYKVIRIDIVLFWKNVLQISKGLILPIIMSVVIRMVGITSRIYFFTMILIYTVVYIVSMLIFGLNKLEKEYLRKYIKVLRW